MSSSTISLPTFDFAAFTAALNARRRELGLDWGQLAADLWDQSAALNADLDEGHTMCGGALSRLPNRNDTSCQYAMFVLRWMDGRPRTSWSDRSSTLAIPVYRGPGTISACGGISASCTPP
jgi:hypothetical protein